MKAFRHAAATNDGAETWNPDERMGRVVAVVLDLKSVALNGRQGVDRLWNKERVGSISTQLTFPYILLEVLGSLDEIGGLSRRENLRLGESLVESIKTEVIVRVVVGHEDVLQVLFQSLDLLDEFLSILLLKLCVDKGGIFLAIDNCGSHGEDSIGSGVVNLERQPLGIAADDDGHEGYDQ